MSENRRTKYKVRINYKSGHSEEFWVYRFTVNKNGSIEWETVNPKIRPIDMGVDKIESIWQVDAITPEEENFDADIGCW